MTKSQKEIEKILETTLHLWQIEFDRFRLILNSF
jgi:hypothetical protein